MNKERWVHLRDPGEQPGGMDWRHVEMIHSALMNELPESVVEIGCFWGFSTSAIIEALEQTDKIKRVDLVDCFLTEQLHKSVLEMRMAGRILAHQMNSLDYTGKAECWIIDGTHGPGAHKDYDLAMKSGRIIVIHDSNPKSGWPQANSGAWEIAERLKQDATYWFEDLEKRPGELTERGILFGFMAMQTGKTALALEALAG